MKRSCVLITVVLVAFLSPNVYADTVCGRVALFDGKSLEGWSVLNCEARVVDGAILLAEGNGLVQTEKKYGDFVLEYEWKALAEDNWDSGVYFRYVEVPKERPWPERYQVNLRKGMEGNCDGLDGAKSEGMTKPGEWNAFKLTVKGDTAALEINGEPAWTGKGLEGPESGFIALQAETPNGGQFLFRNIYLTELDAAMDTDAIALFNGNDLSGWHIYLEDASAVPGEVWQVKEGAIWCKGEPTGFIRTKQSFDNFKLTLEWQWPETPGNSGVLVRMTEEEKVWPLCMEAQLKHENAGDAVGMGCDFNENQSPPEKFYRWAPKHNDSNEKEPGSWNTYEIVCKGDVMELTVNGLLQNTATGICVEKGFIGLQSEGAPIMFRNIEVTPIDSTVE